MYEYMFTIYSVYSYLIYYFPGPVNNIQIVRRPLYLNPRVSSNVQSSSRRHGSLLPPALDKYVNTTDKNTGINAVIRPQSTYDSPLDASYLSCQVIDSQIQELKVFNCPMDVLKLLFINVDKKRFISPVIPVSLALDTTSSVSMAT